MREEAPCSCGVVLEIKCRKYIAICLLFGALLGLTELVCDPRWETTDAILREVMRAINENRLEQADQLMAIVSHRKLFLYQEAWLKKSRGDYFRKTNNRGQARKAYAEAKALSIIEYSLDARFELANMYLEENKYDKAMREFESLLSLIPVWDIYRNNANIRFLMGDSYIKVNRYTDAIGMYESVRNLKGVRAGQIVDADRRIADLKELMKNNRLRKR